MELGWTERGLWAAEGERFDNACVIVHPNHASILGRGKANWAGRGLFQFDAEGAKGSEEIKESGRGWWGEDERRGDRKFHI